MREELRPRRTTLIAGILLLFALIVGGTWGLIAGFSDAMGCKDQLVRRIDSPDTALSVIKFIRRCGATAPDTLQVNIQPIGSDLDSGRYPSFLILDSLAGVEPIWEGQRLLTVKLDTVATTYRSEPESLGVHISYLR